jgi:hypothetical protein
MSDVAEKVHASLGASTASRWMACPGSVSLTQHIAPRPSSIHAEEGTAAHALAELCLRKGHDPVTFVGTTLEGVDITDEMAEYTAVFVDYCKSLCETDPAGTVTWIEKQFNLSALNPPGPMFGTADFVVYDPRTRELEIVDFKYGKGVVVDVFENKQLRYYALGAAIEIAAPIDDVKMTIVQPRATHKDGVIRSETISFVDLLGFTNELLAAAKATTEPDAPLHAGAHCRWCPASGQCPEQRRAAQAVAVVEFSALPAENPPRPELVPVETLVEYMGKFHILEAWMASIRAYVQTKLERGEAVPGYKLVARRANRSWVSASETEQWLRAKGWEPSDYLTQDLKSPAQIEKLVGKKALPVEMTQKVSSGVTMVPSTDARDGITLTPGSEFTALPRGESE